MAAPIIHLNGLPGVGKLTVGRILAEQLGGRLLDNHSIYNVAFSLTTPRTDAFYETVRAVRSVAYERAVVLDPTTPLVLTNAHFQDSQWGNECWDAAIELARKRSSKLFIAVLHCQLDEHELRIRSPERAGKRKPQDPTFFTAMKNGRQLIDRGGDERLHLDTTGLSPEETASRLHDWVTTHEGDGRERSL